jgi:hypothetical protein
VRRWLVRPFVWGLLTLVLLLAGGIWFTDSRYARDHVADLIRADLADVTGRPAHLGSVSYSLVPLSLELRDLVIPGPTAADPPVAVLPRVRVRIPWDQLRQRIVMLDQVDLVRPSFYLQLNRDGTNNLPHPKPHKPGPPSRLEIRIGHLLVRQGSFRFNEHHSEMSVDAHDIAAFGEPNAQKQLIVLLMANRITTQLPNALAKPLDFSARGTLDLGRSRIDLARVKVAWPDLEAIVNGSVAWKEGNRIDLSVQGRGDARWLNHMGYMKEPIEGPTAVDGTFRYADGRWQYQGTLRSSKVHVLGRNFQNLETKFLGGEQRLDIQVERAAYADGSMRGKVVVETGANPGPRGGRPVNLDLTLSNLALEPLLADQFPEQFALPGEPVAELGGRATGTLKYRFESPDPMLGIGDLDLQVEGGAWAFPGGAGLPVHGDVPLRLDRGVISSERIALSAPQQEAVVTGFRYDVSSEQGHLDYELATQSTGALLPVLPPSARANPGSPTPYPVWLPSAGHGSIHGGVSIEHREYRAELNLDLTDVTGELGNADRLHGTLTVERLAVEDLRLEAQRGAGALILSGRVVLPVAASGHAHASLASPASPATPASMALGVDAAQWPAEELVRFLPAGSPQHLEGSATGRLDLSGNPDSLVTRIQGGLENLVVEGIPVGRLKGTMTIDPAHVTLSDATAETPAGRIAGRGAYGRIDGGIELSLAAPSLALDADPIAKLARRSLPGRAAIQASIGGTLKQPTATLTLHATDLLPAERAARGPMQPVSADASVRWDGSSVTVEARVPGLLEIKGGGSLDLHHAELRADATSPNLVGLAGLVSTVALPALSASARGEVTVRADFDHHTIEGQALFSELRAEYSGKHLSNRAPVAVDLSTERVTIRSFDLGEVDGSAELSASGTIELATQPERLDLRIQAAVPASWAALWLPSVDINGQLSASAAVHGSFAKPEFSGHGDIKGGRFIVPTLSSALDSVEGTFRLDNDRVVLENLHARVGGGTVRVDGQLLLPAPDRPMSYRADLVAEGVSLRYPACCISRGDARIALISTSIGRQIVGTVNLDRLQYFENFNVDAVQLVLRSLRRERLQIAETGGVLASTQINLSINGPGVLRVHNNVADVHGGVNLNLVGTLAKPILFGSIVFEPGGTLLYADNRFKVERGALTFSNPHQLDPLIDLELQTTVQTVDITLSLSGTLDHLNAKFSSSTNLADLDIMSLLAGGQRIEGDIGPPPQPTERTETSQAVASNFLAGQAASALTSRVGRLFGLDRFRIDPLSQETGQSVQGVAFTVGKRLSSRLFVTYSSDPSSTTPTVWQVEYQAGRNVVLLLTQSGRGDYALDVQWGRRF